MKTIIKTAIISSIIILVCATGGCDANIFSKCAGNYYFDHSFVFELHDFYTKENLMQIGINKYHKDTVKMYNESGDEMFSGPIETDGRVLFSLVQANDFGASDLTFHKEFFLYLNQYDTDTLIFDFTMKYDAKCKEQDMVGMSIVYNDSVYFDQPNDFTYYMYFYKK